jgi:hypothetical protein
MRLPADEEHLQYVVAAQTALIARPRFEPNDPQWKLVSIALSAMYQAGTCHRGCNGGPHILEALAGRCYNLACSAVGLMRLAQYDEALGLIRSMGEIHNLLLMFALEPGSIQRWLASDKSARLREFSPVKVRIAIEKHGPIPTVNEGWYSEMCEKYVHVHPGTRPNNHSADMSGWVGGVVQKDGEEKVLGELFQVSFTIALAVCRWFSFADLQGALVEALEEVRREG